MTGISISGADAGNDTANSSASTTADITPKSVTAAADPKPKILNESDPAFTSVSVPTLHAGDTLTGGLSHLGGEAVGVYPILIGTLSAGDNYATNHVGANLTITCRL